MLSMTHPGLVIEGSRPVLNLRMAVTKGPVPSESGTRQSMYPPEQRRMMMRTAHYRNSASYQRAGDRCVIEGTLQDRNMAIKASFPVDGRHRRSPH
jgi:hypothetical protein